MLRPSEITLEKPIDTVMRECPKTVAVLMKHKIHCVGCAFSRHHTVRDAAEEHGVDARELIRLLRAVEERKCPGGAGGAC